MTPQRSSSVQSETTLRTLGHISMNLRWQVSVRKRITTEILAAARRQEVKLTNYQAFRLSHKLADLTREGYSQDLCYGNEGEWTKDSRMKAIDGYFRRLVRMCTPRNSHLRLRLMSQLQDN
jgi:hypothetical protein